MIVASVKFKSNMTLEEVKQVSEDTAGDYESAQGLIQKYYYVDNQTGEVGGLLFWESEESMNVFFNSEPAQNLGTTFALEQPPRIELLEVFKVLR